MRTLVIFWVLMQHDKSKEWHHIAYASRKLTPLEQNYIVAKGETPAVMFALKLQ